MTTAEVDRLSAGKYLSLTTFKRDGTAVATPVWVTRDGEQLYVITKAHAGKIKRLRHTSRVLLAPCDMRGRVDGPATEGTARVLDDPAEIDAALGRARAKYGFMYRLNEWFARLRKRAGADEIAIEITPGPAA